MSITEFARAATPAAAGDVQKPVSSKHPQSCAPSDIVISMFLVHLLRHDNTRQKLLDYLIEKPNDFCHFVDLLVPYGTHYLREISMLAKAAKGHTHLREGIEQAYARYIGIIYHDAVKTKATKVNGHMLVEVVDEESWKNFLGNCAKRPELAFVIDVARHMTSPFGNQPYLRPIPDVVTADALPQLVPAGMH